MKPGAVVVGAHVNGLGVIRSLGARGTRIASISTRFFDIAHHSRFVAERHALPELHQRREALVELLEANAGRWDGWAVFPTNDDALTALAQHHARLSRTYRLTVQPWEQVAPLVDKDGMDVLARAAGVDLPTCWGAATDETAALSDLRYPVLVKPIQHDRLISLFGTKVLVARNADELGAAVARLESVGIAGLVYELIPGPDSNLYVYCVYLDATGEPSPGITVRKLRQNPPGVGGARAAAVVANEPRLRDATVALLRRAGFRGMAFAEFKRDPVSGRFLFIEVNARAVLFNAILPPTGLDLAAMAWDDFVLGAPVRPRLTGWRGSWVHLQADLMCAVRYCRVEHLGIAALTGPYRRPVVFGDWSLTDPKPFLAQTALAARSLLRTGARDAKP